MFNTQLVYVLKSCAVLAKQYIENPNSVVTIAHIAKEVGMSHRYLVQLCIRLRSTGVARSDRGKSGGYILTRHPKEINLWNIAKIFIEDFPSLESDTIFQDMYGQLVGQALSNSYLEMKRSFENTSLYDLIPK
jgi:Rrf2 family protein